jgi:hypothetical protein
MPLDAAMLNGLVTGEPEDAWRTLIAAALAIAAGPLTVGTSPSEVIKRDRAIGELDHFLSTSGWDLWHDFGQAVERNAERLVRWWAETYGAKAVLILDGLSLRELPWLLQGAKERGFTLHEVSANAAELPGETDEFAQALGFFARSQLQNNGGALTGRLSGATTECVKLPWQDCAKLIDASPNWLFWHPWPDSKIHDTTGAGQGLDVLTRDVAEQLSSDDFWAFVERLATGRRLVITSDHGYAATGLFFDASGQQGNHLKATFKNGRNVKGAVDPGPFIPPVALQINGPHCPHTLVLGRWKWSGQGGYPTLAHGGLSLLEVLTPFVELTK